MLKILVKYDVILFIERTRVSFVRALEPMDITKYFKRVDMVQLPEEEHFKVANVAVSEELAKIRSVKRKRTAGENRCYNNETKTKIARYAEETLLRGWKDSEIFDAVCNVLQ